MLKFKLSNISHLMSCDTRSTKQILNIMVYLSFLNKGVLKKNNDKSVKLSKVNKKEGMLLQKAIYNRVFPKHSFK